MATNEGKSGGGKTGGVVAASEGRNRFFRRQMRGKAAAAKDLLSSCFQSNKVFLYKTIEVNLSTAFNRVVSL
jgi:hypothetical protein